MILEAIAESNKLNKSQNIIDESDEKKSNIETLPNKSDNLQTMNDQMLAVLLQKEEQKQLLRKV